MAKRSSSTASEVLDTLQKKLWVDGAYAFMREVQNGTGYDRQARRVDALVVSCWPSRGIFAMGVEVKVDRQDWLKELKTPQKSADIQKYCKQWWVATTPGIVKDGELPRTWGLIEVEGGKCTIVEKAPDLEATEPSWSFVASVLRQSTQMIENARRSGQCAGKREAGEELDELRAKNAGLSVELEKLKSQKNLFDELNKQLDEVEKATGIHLTRWDGSEKAIKAIRLAWALQRADVAGFAQCAEQIAAAARMAGELCEVVKWNGDHEREG
jgi:hypothetical protein